jgi:GxxExxY protein
MKITRSSINDLIYQVIGAAIEVHRHLGPGLLESVYQQCMEKELSIRGIGFQSQIKIPVDYKGLITKTPMRCDLFIENILPVELKTASEIIPLNKAQLMTYMKLPEVPKGLMINFNSTNIFNEGQRTFVNERYRNLPD